MANLDSFPRSHCTALHSGKGRGLGHILNYAVKSAGKSGLVAVFG